MYSGLGLHATALDCLAGSAADGGKWGALAARRVALTQCWAATWPYCFALAATYTCTLAIFPGFLAEDVHVSGRQAASRMSVLCCMEEWDCTDVCEPHETT